MSDQRSTSEEDETGTVEQAGTVVEVLKGYLKGNKVAELIILFGGVILIQWWNCEDFNGDETQRIIQTILLVAGGRAIGR